MTNEEKARELAIKYCKEIDPHGKEVYNIGSEVACCEMAKWKDEQYATVVANLFVALDELKHQVKSLLP